MLKFLLFLTVASLLRAKPLYDFSKSYVTQLTRVNFNEQVHKIRQTTNQVSLVHFYKASDDKSPAFAKEYDKWTNEYRGVFKIGSVDCEDYADLCKKEDVTEFPTIKLYAPIPIPPAKYEGQLKIEEIQKWGARFLHSNVIEITNANVATFLSEHPSVPKVLLFTDKKGVPMIYKGLSVAFEKKLNFGIVRNSDSILMGKYDIKGVPAIIVIKTGEKKPFLYKGTFIFPEIFEFLNIYSEVFVPGGGSTLDSDATKKWMTEIFPEFYSRSANDICLEVENTLCVILLTNKQPAQDTTKVFDLLNTQYDRKIERGAKFKFMWLNAATESKWGELFGYAGEDKVVILNPGKRKRFSNHEGSVSKQSISSSIEKIIGGEGKFNRVAEVPQFTERKD